MNTWQWLWLACIPAGVIVIALGVVGFDVIACQQGTPTLSSTIARFGERNTVAAVALAVAWFGLGFLMVGHWWWPVD